MIAGERGFQRTTLSGIIIVFLILFLFNGQHVALSASVLKNNSSTEKDNSGEKKIRCVESDFSSLYLFNICPEEEENECLAISIRGQSKNPFLFEDKRSEKYLSHRKYFFTPYPLYLLNQSLLI